MTQGLPGLVPPPPRPARTLERLVRLRMLLMALSLCLWALIVLLRLVQLQVFGRESFARQAARQSERTINLDPRRGPILDRSGRPLAVSVDVQSVYAVPQEIEDPPAAAAALARVLGLDAAGRRDLLAQLQRNRAFVWVKRKVDPQVARAVHDLRLEGIGFLTENRRYYPKRELASQVLGWVGLDNTGMSGIEYSFEKHLRGRGAKVVVRRYPRGRSLGPPDTPSTEGRAVVLTIDEAIQHAAERELDRAMFETGSIAGMVLVSDPTTGEILALANRPTFNPNRFAAYGSARWRNRAVADAYEPGSIFKIFTAAAALAQKAVDPDEVIDCGNGSIEIAGNRINDHAVFDRLSFRQVIAKSSDVGVIRVAQRVGREPFNRYLRDFGFGLPTGIDLPGESTGLLRPTSRWSALSLASLAFGQEIGVTALQMSAAAGAVANGGYLMRPLIVRDVEDGAAGVVKAFKPLAVRRVLEPETVETLTALLEGVVREGTGTLAAIPGYRVAGKTGTGQKVEPSGRYSATDHVASFVGFVPARRPALVVLVSLDTPRGPKNQGGDVAAPLFARVTERALRRLGIPPDDPERVLRAHAVVNGLTPIAYHPSATVEGAADGAIRRMPDLRGRPAREAAIAAARRGLIVELKGTGSVTAQAPPPGAAVEAGMTCVLTLDRAPAAPLRGGR